MSRPLLDNVVYMFIDAKLSKDGSITTVDVTRALGLGRQKVSSLFTKYRTEHPQNMYHNKQLRCYVRGDNFKKIQLTHCSDEDYINGVSLVFGGTLGSHYS